MFKYNHMSRNLLLFLQRLGIGLRTQNTLSWEMGTRDYRVSIYRQSLVKYQSINLNLFIWDLQKLRLIRQTAREPSIYLNQISPRQTRPWWPSGLRQHAISQLIVAPEGLVRIPLEAKIYMVAICTHYNSLPTEYDIDRPESEITCHYSNSRAPGNLRLLTISTRVRPLKMLEGLAGSQCRRQMNVAHLLLLDSSFIYKKMNIRRT